MNKKELSDFVRFQRKMKNEGYNNDDYIIDAFMELNAINHIKAKVVFIGIHNKPRLGPLCSTTKTGKIIDKIINQLPRGVESVKTNLFDTDYMPKVENRLELIHDWIEKHYTSNVITLRLGNDVQSCLMNFDNLVNYICIKHPAAIFGKDNEREYVDKALVLITEMITKQGDDLLHNVSNAKRTFCNYSGTCLDKRTDDLCVKEHGKCEDQITK